MKIAVMGAAGGEVTGSAYMVQTKKARVLVDCGLFQGGKAAEAKNRPPCQSTIQAYSKDIVSVAESISIGGF